MSGEVTVRPLHLTPIGKEKVPTPADKSFEKYVKDSNNKNHYPNPMFNIETKS